MRALPVVLTALIGLLLATLDASAQTRAPAPPRAVTPRGPLMADELNNIAVFKAASPSVVNITALGLERDVVTLVESFSVALALARNSDLIASVPERHTGNLRDGMHSFPLPVAVPAITISMLWHPRMDADPAHRWLRGCVREVCSF